MARRMSGLSAKLIASVLILSVLLCATISYMGYREFTTVLEDQYNRSAYEIAETVKTYLNPDMFGHYLETGEKDDEYDRIEKLLDSLVISTDTYTIYVTKLSDGYSTSTYIYDAVHPDTGFSRYELGYTAKDMDPQYQEEVERMMTTGERSAVYFYSYSEASGAHTTAAIPVEDSSGAIVAMIGVEKAMTTSPLPRMSDHGMIDPMTEPDFSAFVFKIQANMNKAHRDRIAFMRICSGEFDAGMTVYHVQGGKDVRLSQPQQMMASERKIIDKAYGGDIIGVFDPGIFSIGDTLTTSKEKFAYEGIPTFAPEHFARVRQVDTMKRKQFVKGINQIAQEGAIQIFQEYNTGMEEIIVGVVGVLQFDVLKYRLKNEYNVEIILENLPYEHIRWIENEGIDLDHISGTSDMKKIKDLKDRPLLLFVHEWSIRMTQERNEGLLLSEFGR